jgi:hypothetical protein
LPDLYTPYTFEQLDRAMKRSFGVDQANYWCRKVLVNDNDGSSKQLVNQISLCIDKDPASLEPRNCLASGKGCVRGDPFDLIPFGFLNEEQ